LQQTVRGEASPTEAVREPLAVHSAPSTVAEYVKAAMLPPPLVAWQVPFTSNAIRKVLQLPSL
jgi:hypothetical protein